MHAFYAPQMWQRFSAVLGCGNAQLYRCDSCMHRIAAPAKRGLDPTSAILVERLAISVSWPLSDGVPSEWQSSGMFEMINERLLSRVLFSIPVRGSHDSWWVIPMLLAQDDYTVLSAESNEDQSSVAKLLADAKNGICNVITGVRPFA